MIPLHERIEAEWGNVLSTCQTLPRAQADLSKLDKLSLAGVGALIHNLYNGIENITKQVVSENVRLPTGDMWHRDLLDNALSLGLFDGELRARLRDLLAFRHFFVHAYSHALNWMRLQEVLDGVESTLDAFRESVTLYAKKALSIELGLPRAELGHAPPRAPD